MEWVSLVLFVCLCCVLMMGYPVALTLAGVSLLFAFVGHLLGGFDIAFLSALPSRLSGVMTNQTLIAVPLFVLMGVILEKSKLAEDLLQTMAACFRKFKSGMAFSVVLVGALLAASTGIVGATVVTMGLLSLPTMLKQGYRPEVAAGTICATGTLGQIIPPSIALVLLGDVLSSAYQKAQLDMGIFAPETVSVADLFVGALIPGLVLVALYALYVIFIAPKPEVVANTDKDISVRAIVSVLVPPLALILVVLGSILAGIATPTEAAGVGAVGALILAGAKRLLTLDVLKQSVHTTASITSMIFLILIGASIFALVFRGFGGDQAIQSLLSSLPGGVFTAMLIVMLAIFLLGFILDFIEITFVVVPLVAPALFILGIDPIWLGIMLAINLQTSFLTPPFGFALFYLRGVAPESVSTKAIYKGVIPFIVIQLLVLVILAVWPELAVWLPEKLYG